MTEPETINSEVANGVLQRMMQDSPITERIAERIFKSKFYDASGPPPPEIKRYRSTSHRPDAACVAKTQGEAREWFRKLMGVEKLPDNFKLVRF